MSDVIEQLKALVREKEQEDPVLAAHIAQRIIDIKREEIA